MPSQVVESRGRLFTLPVRPNVKGPRGLYLLGDPEEQAIEEKYNSITKPLTLLSEFGEKKQEIVITRKDGRPVTPVEKAVLSVPVSLEELNNIIRKRICPNEVLPLTIADQQCLAAIILGEVTNQWEDLRRIPENPLLNKQENKELVKRVFLHIVVVCEELFFHYNAKLQLLNKSGVFTGPANIARLRGQLALDADKFLNVGYIRRRIAREIVSHEESVNIQVAGQGPKLHLTQDELFDISRPHKAKTIITVAHREIKDMMNRMPDDLDLEAVTDLLPEKAMVLGATSGLVTPRSLGKVGASNKHQSEKISTNRGIGTERDSGAADVECSEIRLVRSKSHDEIRWDRDRLEDEIGEFKPKPLLIDVHEEAVYRLRRENIPQGEIYSTPQSPDRNVAGDRKSAETPVKEIDEKFIRDDLEKRSQYVPLKELNEGLPEEEELPPLLQASSKYNHVEGRLEALERQLEELEKSEQEEIERQRRELYESASSNEPRHPQPAVISTKLPNFMVVRTNDVRVSDRVSLNSLTLKSYPPVFNHLTKEIAHDTVKRLDARLFYDQEINELYDEMLGSAPGDHLSMELDPEVEPAGGKEMKISDTSASWSLFKKPSERVVNKDLQPTSEGLEPPWAGVGDMEDWRRTADGSFKGSHEMLIKLLRNKDHGGVTLQNDDPFARDHNAWMTWWKTQVDQQDYLKFLSASEGDYLQLLLHLFKEEDELAASAKGDSDSEDEYLKNPHDTVLQMLPPKSREKNAKLIEAVREKEKYSEGFWNARSVSIGGLGKLPSRKEVEDSLSGTNAGGLDGSRNKENTILSTEGTKSGFSRKTEEQPPVLHKLTLALLDGKDRQDALKEQKAERQRRKAAGASLQDRLEQVWNDLRVPDQMRLDMALKYSGEPWVTQISSAINAWERCAVVILAREQIMSKLELFETQASDPDRFFKKGHAGSSRLRLKESKMRQEFEESLKKVEVKIAKHCQYIEQTFNDIVSYQGRPYLQKMKFDRTEMLYWLQQERREKGLERELLAQKFPINGVSNAQSKDTRPLSSNRKKAISPIILEPIA
ncbi:coiled-coil domain-containing protein 87-like [Convolutriloba macropyga]|uniref:coiled-coil domain-containing protein 87-like n=1 Tax=Convolutriloba macropyga TaxID=536237 RepID=UPI003F5269EA